MIFRYVRQCSTIFQSEILGKLFWPMMCFASVAAAVCGVYTANPVRAYVQLPRMTRL